MPVFNGGVITTPRCPAGHLLRSADAECERCPKQS